jgi:glucose-6-phosphate isomerase
MPLPFPRCDQTVAWAALQGHWQAHGRVLDLRTLFEQDPMRFDRFMLSAPHLQVDLSRAHWDVTTFAHLQALARECRLDEQRQAMFAGDVINRTEQRAVLHTALRAPRGTAPHSAEVHAELDRFLAFAEQVRATAGGAAPGAIHDVVCLGIGGSYLGPQMAVEALDAWGHPGLNFHFVSNMDGQALAAVLRRVQARHTLFVLASKSFKTPETMANALTARQWFFDQGGTDVAHYFVATTTNVAVAQSFGIRTTFGFWDWVGGRFSMWSSIGLSIALAIGAEQFRALLAGAHAMDQHFKDAPLAENVPICLGLMDVWNRNFMAYTSRCISPYLAGLKYLPAYLQQLVMESNGKSVDQAGQHVPFATSDVIWGEPGTNGQHAFFQMLHQGTDVVPVEFVVAKRPNYRGSAHWSPALHACMVQQHRQLLANALAQARTLMMGRQTDDEASDADANVLTPHRAMPGNRPSLTLLVDQLDPVTLGALVALYEHRTFVAGALWGINSFDQWGVELGKVMCQALLPLLEGPVSTPAASTSVAAEQTLLLDAATAGLIKRLR